MIAFRNVVGNASVNSFWDNGKNQIAFCRGTRGFIAFNNEATEMNVKLFTCMPSGDYCDIITGTKQNGQCSGTTVSVDENGDAQIVIPSNVGVLAIHIGVSEIIRHYLKRSAKELNLTFPISGMSYHHTSSDTRRTDLIS